MRKFVATGITDKLTPESHSILSDFTDSSPLFQKRGAKRVQRAWGESEIPYYFSCPISRGLFQLFRLGFLFRKLNFLLMQGLGRGNLFRFCFVNLGEP